MSEIGVGLVGYRFMDRAHSNAYRQVGRFFDVDPVPRLRAIRGRDEAAVSRAADDLGWEGYETDFARLLKRDDIDLVDISTPGYTHHELALAALEAVKPVLCEKPLTATMDEAKQVVDAEVEHGRKLVQVGFMRLYDPQHVAVAREATGEGIGRPLMFKGVHRAPEVPLEWDSEFVVRNALVHDLDSARWMLGQEIEEVFVRGVNNDPALGEDTWDLQSVQLGMSGDCMASVEVFVTARYGYEVNAELVCERGIAQTPLPHDAVVRSEFNRYQRVPEGFLGRFPDAYEIEVERWIDALREGEVPVGADAWDGYISLVASEGCVKSLNTGSPERLDKPERPKLYSS